MEDQTVQTLLSLQELDVEIAKLRDERRQLQAELEEIDEKAAAWSAGETEQQSRIDETAHDVRRAERKVKAGREIVERLKERQKRLRSQREAEAAKIELDAALANLDDAETVLLEEMQAHDRARIRMEDMGKEHGEQREEAESRVAEIEERLVQLEAQLDRLVNRRGETADSIDQKIRSEYDRVRGGRTDQALAPVVDGVCGHCFTAIPLQRQAEIRAGRKLVVCEGCGVILHADQ